ncbi:MAG: hypothetical protein U0263_38995 [Polyangiaceae bacterium]
MLFALVGLLGGRVVQLERALARSETGLRDRLAGRTDAGAREGAEAEAERRLAAANAEWALRVRKLTHDARSPLSVLKSNVGCLRDTPPAELQREAGPPSKTWTSGWTNSKPCWPEASAHAKRYETS